MAAGAVDPTAVLVPVIAESVNVGLVAIAVEPGPADVEAPMPVVTPEVTPGSAVDVGIVETPVPGPVTPSVEVTGALVTGPVTPSVEVTGTDVPGPVTP